MNKSDRTPGLVRTYASPAALACVTLAALLLGLLRDGWPDWIALAGLATPLAVAAFFVRR
jgi:hypothetical protein